jgi:hypothetical protein
MKQAKKVEEKWTDFGTSSEGVTKVKERIVLDAENHQKVA